MCVTFGSGATAASVNLLRAKAQAPEGWEQAAGVQVPGGAVGQTARPAEELPSQAVSTKDAASFLVAVWDVGLPCFVSYFLLQWFIWVLRTASVTVIQYRKARLGNTPHTGHVSAAKLSLGFFTETRCKCGQVSPSFNPLLFRCSVVV